MSKKKYGKENQEKSFPWAPTVIGMCAVELANDSAQLRLAHRTCAAMVKRGVLSRSLGSNVILVPPLTVTAQEIDLIVTTLAEALQEVAA